MSHARCANELEMFFHVQSHGKISLFESGDGLGVETAAVAPGRFPQSGVQLFRNALQRNIHGTKMAPLWCYGKQTLREAIWQ